MKQRLKKRQLNKNNLLKKNKKLLKKNNFFSFRFIVILFLCISTVLFSLFIVSKSKKPDSVRTFARNEASINYPWNKKILIPTPTLISKIQTTEISFPKDHAEHKNFNNEWWYLNLMLRVSDENENLKDLAYIISFSRIAGKNTGLLTSRYEYGSFRETTSFAEHTYTGGSLQGILIDNLLKVKYQGDSNLTLEELTPAANGAKRYHLAGSSNEIGYINIELSERTISKKGYNTPLLWGCTGNISVFGENDTYYYSIPDLDITGKVIDIDNNSKNVIAGKAWIDHQWFNSSPSSDWKGHYWMSFHYSEKRSFDPNSIIYDKESPHGSMGFVTQIYNAGPKYTYWVRRETDGSNLCGSFGTFSLIKSYVENGYPQEWNTMMTDVENGIPNFLVNVRGKSLSSNQIFHPPVGPEFFEGASSFSGVRDSGVNFKGLGFIETHVKK